MTHVADLTAAEVAMTRQLELEEEMRSRGIDRYRAASRAADERGQSSKRQPAQRIIAEAHDRILAAIGEFRAAARSGKAGRKHSAIVVFDEVEDDDLLAHLALRQVMDRIADRPAVAAVSIALGSLIEDELFYRAFAEQDPTAYKFQMRKMEEKTSSSYKRASTRITGKKKGVAFTEWDKRKKLLVGSKLVEFVVEKTGLVEATRVGGTRQETPVLLIATPETLAWMESEDGRREWLMPLYMPCIIPPKPWTTPFDGGYHGGRVRRLTLVKSPNRAYLHELAGQEMPQVYAAINALQDTAWAINKGVLEVMETLWETRSDMEVIPQVDPAPAPQKPGWLVEGLKAADMNEAQLAEFKEWRRAAAQVFDANVRLVGKRRSFVDMMQVGRKFVVEEAIYYPYQLDWRGRIYPVPLYLHPQGNDAARGLLQFATEVPVHDVHAARWLAIHGAGLWGIDKVDMDERVEWIEAHEAEIIAAANDPYQHAFWTSAEKPWQALAFCFDWAGFKAQGFGYLSSLPVQMDGTCNGLQNFSAILRDEIGGAAVNLIPADKPQDIYTEVMKLVIQQVTLDAACEDEKSAIARGWVGNIVRKTVKRPVMTLAYGARAYGFKQMVFDDTVCPWRQDSPETFPWQGAGWLAAEYLGGVIWGCVGQVVVAARAAMDWLQESAKVAAADELPVIWRSPAGLLVQQAYRTESVRRIDLAFGKVNLKLSIREDNPKLDKRKQGSGIAPNWVHSLDAAHMQRTICAAHALGLRSFSMIHDSYGTHAGNAQALGTVLREEFVRMYNETDVLADFAEALRRILPEGTALPPLPTKGTLDLSLILESQFFFA